MQQASKGIQEDSIISTAAASATIRRYRQQQDYVVGRADLEEVRGLEEGGLVHWLQSTCFISAKRRVPA